MIAMSAFGKMKPLPLGRFTTTEPSDLSYIEPGLITSCCNQKCRLSFLKGPIQFKPTFKNDGGILVVRYFFDHTVDAVLRFNG
jgi:hypothetical protein